MNDSQEIVHNNLFSIILGLIALVLIIFLFITPISKVGKQIPNTASPFDVDESVCKGVDFKTNDIDSIIYQINTKTIPEQSLTNNDKVLVFNANPSDVIDLGKIMIDNFKLNRFSLMCLAVQKEIPDISSFYLYKFISENDFEYNNVQINKDTEYVIDCQKSKIEIKLNSLFSLIPSISSKTTFILKEDYSKTQNNQYGYLVYYTIN